MKGTVTDNRISFVIMDLYRPRIIALYFNEPDSSGHWFGPDANEVSTIYYITFVDLCLR